MKTTVSSLPIIVCFTVLTWAAVPAFAADSVAASDKKFVKEAAQGGMTEVQLGQLAADKATSPDVKEFGSKMVTDHGQAGDELKSIATTKGLTISDKLDAKHQSKVDKFQKLSGADFDKAYVKEMVADHKTDDAAFSKEASAGKDSDIKAFATKTDQVVKMHLSMIQDIQSKMK
jgi:putative membrane protein